MVSPFFRHDDLFFSTLPLFANLPHEVLRAHLSEEMVHSYQDGEILCHQGDVADCLFVLLHGSVAVSTDGTFLLVRKPYDVLGELAFINTCPRNATLIAQGMVQALVLPQMVLGRLLALPTFTNNLLRLVAEKLHESTNERAFRFRNEALLFSEFRAHLSPEVVQRLLATGMVYGQPRFLDAILLFADIRDFTEHAARMQPEQIAQELNVYFNMVVTIIHAHGGMIDKFIGDAVFVLWGIAPAQGDAAQQAFTCARTMLLAARTRSFGGASIRLGIGLNAGRVFSGNIGSEGKRQFTVLGHPVNLAARCESATKELHAPMVLTEDFALRLPPALFAQLTPHEPVTLKGAGPQTLYTYYPPEMQEEEG